VWKVQIEIRLCSIGKLFSRRLFSRCSRLLNSFCLNCTDFVSKLDEKFNIGQNLINTLKQTVIFIAPIFTKLNNITWGSLTPYFNEVFQDCGKHGRILFSPVRMTVTADFQEALCK
jgi:hypothetical protein